MTNYDPDDNFRLNSSRFVREITNIQAGPFSGLYTLYFLEGPGPWGGPGGPHTYAKITRMKGKKRRKKRKEKKKYFQARLTVLEFVKKLNLILNLLSNITLRDS